MTGLNALSLTTRAYNSLRYAEIATVEQLCAHSAREVATFPNLGNRTLSDIRHALLEVGLCLKGDEELFGGAVQLDRYKAVDHLAATLQGMLEGLPISQHIRCAIGDVRSARRQIKRAALIKEGSI